VPLLLQPWYWLRTWVMAALPSWLPSLRNEKAEVTLDPYHLTASESFLGMDFPTRSVFYSIEAMALGQVLRTLFVVYCSASEEGLQRATRSPRSLAQDIEFHSGPGEAVQCLKLPECCGEDEDSEEKPFDPLGELQAVRHVQPTLGFTVAKETFVFFADTITDLKQIHDLLLHGDLLLSGVLLFTWVAAQVVQTFRRDYRDLCEEMMESKRNRVKTERYLDIMAWEKGFEGCLSLMLNVYAVRYCIQKPDSCVSGIVGVLLSLYSFSNYLLDQLVHQTYYVNHERLQH